MKWVIAVMLLGAASASMADPPAKSKTSHPTSLRTDRHKKSRRAIHAAPAPSYQLQPDPERYQEIQKALLDRGYFKGEANGAWGYDSIDALKHFQADQKLLDDGKLSALTLIGLGLGPKHDSSGLSASK